MALGEHIVRKISHQIAMNWLFPRLDQVVFF